MKYTFIRGHIDEEGSVALSSCFPTPMFCPQDPYFILKLNWGYMGIHVFLILIENLSVCTAEEIAVYCILHF